MAPAARYNEVYALYKNFLPLLSQTGDPMAPGAVVTTAFGPGGGAACLQDVYSRRHNSAAHLLSLLASPELAEQLGLPKPPSPAAAAAAAAAVQPIVLAGFSKGTVVLNQVLHPNSSSHEVAPSLMSPCRACTAARRAPASRRSRRGSDSGRVTPLTHS